MANNYYNFPVPFIAGTKVRSDQVNTQYSGIEAGFDLLSTDPDASIIGTSFFGTDVQGATVNEYLITTPDPRTPLVNGQRVSFFATHSNDGAVTLNVDGSGLVAGVNLDGDAVVSGQIVSGQFYEWVYDDANTQWLVTKGISGITDPLLLSNGSVGAPTYSFELDPDTGVFQNGADILGFAAGGLLPAHVDASNGAGNLQFVITPDGPQNNATFPALAFGDGDTGIWEPSDDQLSLGLAGVQRWFWAGDVYGSLLGGGPSMLNETASNTNPTLIPDRGDSDTGLGHNGAGEPSLIGNGVELARGIAAASGGLQVNNLSTGAGLERVLTTSDIAGGVGDVFKVGTPVNNELGVWTGDGTIEGDTNLTWDGSTLSVTGNLTVTGTLTGVGDVTKVGTPVNNEIGVWTGDGTIEGDTNLQWDGSQFAIGVAGSAATPAIAFGGTDVGFFQDAPTHLGWVEGGVEYWRFDDLSFQALGIGAGLGEGPLLFNQVPSGTAPTICPGRTDLDTGLGLFAANSPSLIGGGVELARGVAAASGGLLVNNLATGAGMERVLTTSDSAGAGDVFKVGTPANDQLAVWTGDGTLEGSANFDVVGTQFRSVTGNGPAIVDEAASSGNPTLIPRQGDLDTGVTNVGDDRLGLTAGGELGMQLVAASGGVIHGFDTDATVTAFAGGGQGSATQLNQSYNIVTTVATTGDSVKLPPINHVGGLVYIKNDGANALDVFPASGDDLGQGTDTALSVSAGAAVTFMHSVSNTTWTQIQFESATGGDVFKVGTPVDDQIGVWTGDGTIEGNPVFTLDASKLKLSSRFINCEDILIDNAAATGVSFAMAATPVLANVAATGNVPSLIPNKADTNSGLGLKTFDAPSMIAGGVEAHRWAELNGGVIQVPKGNTAVTAFAGGGQGSATQLDDSFNVITTVATGGDSVKLPPVFGLYSIVFIKNDGANAADVFPASGDDLGAGVDTAVSLAAGKSMSFIATSESTVGTPTWTQLIVDTGIGGVPDPLLLGNGSAAAPTYSFSSDTDIGMFRAGADELGFSVGGTEIARYNGTGLKLIDGSAGAPSYSFTSDTDSGFYSSAANSIGVALGGSANYSFLTAEFRASGVDGFVLSRSVASDTNPNIRPVQTDADTGIGQNAADQLSLIAGGVELLRAVEVVGSNQIILTPGLIDNDPTAPTLGFGDGDTGFYEEVDDTIAVALAGNKEFEFAPVGDPQFNDVEMLSNMDGSDGQTTFTEQSNNGASATFVATAELDTAEFKFGTASLLLDGNSDYITYPDIAGYALGSNVWTIEGWVRFASLPAVGDEMYFISQWVQGGGVDEAFAISLIQDGGDYRFRFESEGGTSVFEQGGLGGAPALNTWFHWAAQRDVSDRLTLWFDGTQEFNASGIFSGSINDSTTTLKLGVRDPTQVGQEGWLDGWIDDVRMTIGSTRYTPGGAITPPTAAFPTNSGEFTGAATGAGKLFNTVASLTSPTLVPRNDDDDTGIGGDGSDALAVIAGGVEGVRYTELNDGVISAPAASLAVTAFATGGQGSATQLDNGSNVLGTVATTGDSVKLPPVFAANSVVYVKNDGANAADIFPASGDDLGAGVDTAVSIAAGTSMSFIATVANSTWTQWIVDTSGSGDVVKVGTPVNNQLGVWTGDGTIEGDAGLTWDGSTLLLGGDLAMSIGAAAPTILNVQTAFNIPNLIPNKGDTDTGIGAFGADSLSLIAGGVEGLRFAENSSGVIQLPDADLSITAFAGGGQGSATALIKSYNVITTVATTGDSVALPGVFRVNSLIFIKNDGANAADVFPASGGDLGAGVDTAVSLAAGESLSFIGTVQNSTWTQLLVDTTGGASFPLLAPDGTAGAPSYSFSADTNTGIYRVGANILGFVADGTDVAQVTDTQFLGPIAGVGTPGISFIVDPDTGIDQNAADQLSLISGGVEMLRAIEAGTSATDQVFLPRDGAAATPALALGALTHGFYTGGVAQINASISGARKIFFNSSAFTGDGVSIGVALAAGPRMLSETPSATNPTIIPNQSDGDTGLGWNAAGEPSLIGNGVELARGVAAASGGLQANNADTGGGLERVLTESDLALPEFQFFADQFENPVNADWTVNALAPAAADSNNNGLTVRLFDDTTEEGVGFIVEVPAGATNIVFDFVSRAETAPGAVNTVGLDIYNRGIPDNAAVQAWSAATQLTDLSIPTNEFFQEDTQTVTLATLGVTAGETTQFELVRTTPTGGTDLTGDWALLLAKVSFT